MVIKGTIGKKKIIIEIIASNKELLKHKKKYVYDTYKNHDLHKVLKQIDRNQLNTYVGVKVIVGDRVKNRYEQLLKSNTIPELLEILLLMFQKKEWYEVCQVIINHLDNINY